MKPRHLTIFLTLIACGAAFGAQATLAAKSHRYHRINHRRYGFAVLKRPAAKITDAQQQFLGIPSGAVLAESVWDIKIYVFQRMHNQRTQICVGEEGPKMAGGWACSYTEAAEREGISLIEPKPDGIQKLILLVPNGVKTVSVTTRDNGSAAVAVVNNVAAIEGDLTAYHFVAPNGTDVSAPLEPLEG